MSPRGALAASGFHGKGRPPVRARPRPGAGSRPVRRPRPAPASPKGPTGPTPRANPYPEVTDLICRLPLPTLIYRLEALHLGDLMRIWVRARPKVRDEGVSIPDVLSRTSFGIWDARFARPPPLAGASSLPHARTSQKDARELTTPSEATAPLCPARRGCAGVLRPWVSALACIFKGRRRRAGRRKNRGALRYHDPIALRIASRVTEA